MVESLKIVLLCVISAIVYGILQDLVTTRICVEYFTIGHPPVWGGTQDPTLLALTWGVMATWWVGLILGVPAAMLARIGSAPKMSWRELRRPILVLMAAVGVSAAICGAAASIVLPPDSRFAYFPERLSEDRHRMFAVDLAIHNAAYTVGFVGGIACWIWILWKRAREHRRLVRQEMDELRAERERLFAEVETLRARMKELTQ